ncbi:MAG: transporter [Desulfobulbaceae bacterium]|nr:transporter [Desulfobulbaceae bacterium]
MKNTILNRAVLTALFFLTCMWSTAHAVEGGRSLYLLGKRGPLAGLIPKPGWYITNDVYHYNADTDQKLPIAGVVAQNVSADALVNLFQLTGITETFLGSGRLAVSVLVPYSHMEVSADASTSYKGANIGIAVSDDVTAFGDPVLATSLGWRHRDGDLFRAWNVYGSLFIPVGSYEEGRLANAGANRWGLDIGTGFTLGNFKKGREFSGVLGMTINGENLDTGYQSGLEAHMELTYKQHLASGLSAGLVGYYNYQLTADSGGPAILGDFKGRVAAVGPEVAYQFEFADRSMGLDLRWYHEFDAKNRVQGDSVFLSLSLPLQKNKKE